MTFTLGTATGTDAVRGLGRTLSSTLEDCATEQVQHEAHLVAWASDCRWVTSYDDGDVLVVLDGHVHDLLERDTSPARVLHDRYRRLGCTLAASLLGDFVFIVLDRSRSRLLVSRDPLGTRPWYQASSGQRHAGASDVATLCEQPWVNTSVNAPVALSYLAGRLSSRGRTFHRGITTLPPGHTYEHRPGSTSTRPHHRWAITPEPELGWEEAAARCRQAVDEAVRSRVEVAGGATSDLSGGLDSSAVVGTAVALGQQDVLAGRLLFDGPGADERRYSDAVIEHWGITCLSEAPWIPTDENVEELMTTLRRPPPDPNSLMFASLSRAFLRAGRLEGMTGLGGDDAFLDVGLESRVVSAFQQRNRPALGGLLQRSLRAPTSTWRRELRPTLRSLAPWVRRRPPGYIPDHAPGWRELEAELNETPQQITGVLAIDHRAAGLTAGYQAAVLENAAVVSDMVGYRRSHPFLDPRVIAASYGLDPWFAVRGGHDRALQVAALGDRLPSVVRARRSKAEFSEVMWARGVDDRRIAGLLEGRLVDGGWLDPVPFDNIVRNARGGRPYAALPLWRALTLDSWLRQLTG